MKVLLTGCTGYIAQRLLPVLLSERHEVVCCVRDSERFNSSRYTMEYLKVVEADFLKPASMKKLPADIDAAYYFIHSMSTPEGDFEELEAVAARNFKKYIEQTNVRQVIYLSGITNEEILSKHLSSRRNVERILSSNKYFLTTLRAGIIIGSGSASFEIIRDLVEKLPVMIAPRWLNTRTQPIAIRNVIEYLSGVLLNEETFNHSYDIGGPDVMTYREMLLLFAKVRGLNRRIFILPVMTPKLSSYWLYFITSTSYRLAQKLVDSMKVEIICKDNNLKDLLGIVSINYEDAIRLAFAKIDLNNVISSWKDALTSVKLREGLSKYARVPVYGCYNDTRMLKVENPEKVMDRIWAIGGETGWYYGNWIWGIRGFLDKMVGGVGKKRGRKSINNLSAGDTLDLWRVLVADRRERRLLLFAEMKLPGEAWLEFRIDNENILHQTATFRPLGVMGRLYWLSLLPFHFFVFRGMLKNIAGTG